MATITLTLAELKEQRAKYSNALLSRNTQTGYHYAWRTFATWADGMGLNSLPASSETLGLFVVAELARGIAASTAAHRVAAVRRMHISANHPSPATPEVSDILRGARRLRIEPARQAEPLSILQLRAVSVLLLADASDYATRNRAMILTGFAAALRNSMTAALLVSDLEFTDKGVILKIRREKNDQEGKGRVVGLIHARHSDTCAVIALRAWLAIRGTDPGPLFTRFRGAEKDRALQPERVGQIVKAQIRRIRDDPHFSGHSLRAGFCTEAGTAGASDLSICSQTGHKDLATMRMYFRKRDVFLANPMALMDL